MIHTAESYFGQRQIQLAHDQQPGERAVVYHLPSTNKPAHLWASVIKHGLNHPVPAGKLKKSDPKLYAFVNHGRWQVQCPCDEAQFASENDHHFFCTSCQNKMTGGRLVEVVWPNALDRTRIERFLAPRYEKHQNWYPGETVDLLAAENLEHGINI